MLASVRRKAIYDEIRERKSASVANLAKQFSVTEETIRRDLKTLEAERLVTRSHGGAFIQEGVENSIDASILIGAYVDEKRVIARRARRLISNGDTIFLDSSTSAYWLAEEIKDMRLTILTNNLSIINLLSKSPSIRLVSIGGIYSSEANSFYGEIALSSLDSHYLDATFFSCRSISLDNGITESTERWMTLRREAIRRSNHSYVLADHTKFGRTSFLRICGFDAVGAIVTDEALEPEWCGRLGEMGCTVIDRDESDAAEASRWVRAGSSR